MRKLILIQEPSTMEKALRIANHLETIDATESNDSDREYSNHTTKKKVHNLDMVSGSATAANDVTEMEKQLAEMKKSLDDVRQELTRQVTLTSNNQTRNTVGMPTTTLRNKPSVRNSSGVAKHRLNIWLVLRKWLAMIFVDTVRKLGTGSKIVQN